MECEFIGWVLLDVNLEDILLDIVYEDKYVIVINKLVYMVCVLV